jgi:hypothetical protein
VSLRGAGHSILNKVGQFLAKPLIREMLSQHHPPFTFSKALAKSQIFLVNLSKGHIGKEPANLLGSLILSDIKTSVMAQKNPIMRLYVDEFSPSALRCSHPCSRKRVSTIWHSPSRTNSRGQIDTHVRSAILGNAGTLFVFRVGVEDARLIAPEFHPLTADKLADQFPFNAWVKRGADLKLLQAQTMPPQPPYTGRRATVVNAARMQFCKRRST